MPSTGTRSVDLLNLEDLLPEEERAMQAVVRRYADEELRPIVGDHFEAGTFPVELAREFGKLGVLGMHLDGYGCAGSTALGYGLACLELEAVDSGFRSFVSVQGSLAMFSIHRFGSEEQKQEWLPRMAAGELIGCFGLTEPDHGSDPGSMRTRARRDGDDWILDGSKMWITNAPVADVATVWAQTDDGVRGFLVPSGTRGFEAHTIDRKLSLRASKTGALFLEGVRLPASAMLPEARGLRGPLSCLSEARFGIVFGAVGAARDCLEAALAYASERQQFGKSLAAFQLTQEKLADMSLELTKAMLVALRLAQLKDGDGVSPAQISVGKLNNVREAIAIARTCRTILGGAGITLDYPPLRHANNLESVLTYEGTSEIHTLAIGQELTGVSAYR
jgi:glutaryl-CoA dehydrogenase